MADLIKSKKYQGVYYRIKQNGDRVYYYVYKENNKPIYQKIGLKSEGITEKTVYELRGKIVNTINESIFSIYANQRSTKEILFQEIADFYFNNRLARSQVRRKQLYDLRIKPIFGDMNIYDIKSVHLLKFRNSYIDKLAPHTINIYIELMSSIFNYYIKYQNNKFDNPTLKIDKLPINNTRIRILTLNEIDLLFKTIRNNFMLSLFCALSLSTAGRKSTIINYKVKDINLTNRTINSFDFKNQTNYVSFLDDRVHELLQYRLYSGLYDASPNTSLIYVDNVKDLVTWINRQLKNIFDNLFNVGVSRSIKKVRCI